MSAPLGGVACLDPTQENNEMNVLQKALTVTCFTLAGSMAFAGSDLKTSLDEGGRVLTSDEIAALVVGKVVTAKSGEKTFNFFYAPTNELSGELQGGGWSGTGAFAITDTDQICVSMAQDKGRFRCLTVVHEGDKIRKFNTDGKATFELLAFKVAQSL